MLGFNWIGYELGRDGWCMFVREKEVIGECLNVLILVLVMFLVYLKILCKVKKYWFILLIFVFLVVM